MQQQPTMQQPYMPPDEQVEYMALSMRKVNHPLPSLLPKKPQQNIEVELQDGVYLRLSNNFPIWRQLAIISQYLRGPEAEDRYKVIQQQVAQQLAD